MRRELESSKLLETAISEKLYVSLIQQIEKDFKMANIPLKPLGELEPAALIARTRECVYRLILEDFAGYLNLLYIIDVPEKAFKHLAVTDVVEVADQVSYLILKRELLKVRLKNKYSR